ncbi:MAG: imidazolonepropionase-like amidohydrolase [Planctomycetota bacterium]|jgi:imidazolonepropionase-like amidohydrolase
MFSALLLSFAIATPPVPAGGDLVAIQAGTIHVVEGGRVIAGGGTVLVQGGKIIGVGESNFEIPPGARVVDYGPDAVIIPGLVAVDSTFGGTSASDRTAEPGLSAIEEFDTWGNYKTVLSSGVTTVYLAPARNRLIGGHGAVVKLGGEAGGKRILSESASVHGSISADARRTRGYWQPPVPATVDVGMGVERSQLPRTTMGAIVALRELLALAGNPEDSEEYGPYAGTELAELIAAKTPWRMTAEAPGEIRALVEFCSENGLPLVLDGAGQASNMGAWIASKKFPVVVYSSLRPNIRPTDLGKSEDSTWPDQHLASNLSRDGVVVAVAPARGGSVTDLRLHANLARKGGMSAEDALAAVTMNAAQVLGVANRVGSLSSGKDADIVILSGSPLSPTSGVIATWVDGEVAYKAEEVGSVVLEVKELYLGNGEVLSPGQLLMEDGRIIEVGRRVSHPIGCTVVRGDSAMPGMIDALGHLGLEGSTKAPKTQFKMAQIIEPGDYADRRVAQAGVTTVVLTPRNVTSSGTPAMAYKPAGSDLDTMVVADPAAIHLQWSNSNRLRAGESVLSLLAKAADYTNKWNEYDAAMLTWVPAAEEPGDAKEDEDEDEEDDDDEEAEEEDDDDEKEKKKKKKSKKKPAPKPVTGVWVAHFDDANGESQRLRLQLSQEGSSLEGLLRSDVLSTSLVNVSGTREEHLVTLSGRGSMGEISLSAETGEEKLVGKVSVNGTEYEFEGKQTSEEYVVAGRSARRKPETEEKKKAPKGMPKNPGINLELEPLRSAIEGNTSIVVIVDRADEILTCVAAFEKYGIKPVLSGADEAWKVADELVGRVKGLLLDHRVIYSDSRMGLKSRNRYAEIANAGIRVAFHSNAEEGAAELPLMAAFAVSRGMSPTGAIRALTGDAAAMMSIDGRVGSLRSGMDADVLLLDGDPLDLGTSILRVWVAGREVRLNN